MEDPVSATNSAVKHLFCPKCSAQYDISTVINLCRCGAPLMVDYDLDAASRTLTRDSLSSRNSDMWKYREVLPVLDTDNVVTLGEGGTPLLASRAVGREMGCEQVYFKDESGNPTGSFKARGLSMAVSRAKELGLKRLIIPTAGNAGSALAAYTARAGMEACVLMPKDSPSPFLIDCHTHGARVILVDGTIKDCGERAAEMVANEDWFSVATLKEPYRIDCMTAEAFSRTQREVTVCISYLFSRPVRIMTGFLEITALNIIQLSKNIFLDQLTGKLDDRKKSIIKTAHTLSMHTICNFNHGLTA